MYDSHQTMYLNCGHWVKGFGPRMEQIIQCDENVLNFTTFSYLLPYIFGKTKCIVMMFVQLYLQLQFAIVNGILLQYHSFSIESTFFQSRSESYSFQYSSIVFFIVYVPQFFHSKSKLHSCRYCIIVCGVVPWLFPQEIKILQLQLVNNFNDFGVVPYIFHRQSKFHSFW